MSTSSSDNSATPAPPNDADLQVQAGLRAVRISGADRRSFLQGQLTQDLNQLKPATPFLTGWANPKGRLRTLCWMLDWQDAVWLLMPAGLAASLSRQLAMYVLRSQVTIELPETQIIAVRRSAIETLTNINDNTDDNNINHCIYDSKSAFILSDRLPDAALAITRTDPGSLAAHKLDWLDWRHMNILAGIPSVWPSTSDEFVPQMLNLELLDGISFIKGCYVGQEIVARTQNLGRIKRRMFRFQVATEVDIEPGDSLYSQGSKVGQVVDAVCAAQITDLLAVISLDKLAQEITLDAAGSIPAERQALPYAIPELTG